MTSDATTPARPRRWPLGLLVGLLTGAAGAFLAIPVSDWAMQAHHVSAMEGQRACAAVGLWAPLAFVAGGLVGLLVSLLLGGTGFAGYLRRQGVALAAIALLVLGAGGLGYLTAEHPPTLDGKALALEIETRVPAAGRTVAELRAAEFNVALLVSASDRSYAEIRWSEARSEEDAIIVPAWAALRSRNFSREISAGPAGENLQLFPVALPASPRAADRMWSGWIAPDRRFEGGPPPPLEQYRVRYRVRLAEEQPPAEVEP